MNAIATMNQHGIVRDQNEKFIALFDHESQVLHIANSDKTFRANDEVDAFDILYSLGLTAQR